MARFDIWNLTAPLDESFLAHQRPVPAYVQWGGGALPTTRDHQLLGEFLADYPDTRVRLAATYMASDLEFLSHYSRVHRIAVELTQVTSFEGLRHLRPDLTELVLGDTAKKGVSLAPIHRFQQLKELTLVGQQKDIAVVGSLQTLERLALISIKLPDLSALLPLERLSRFELKLGGTTNLALLPQIGRLQYLEIWRVLGLTDLAPLASLTELEYLFLQHLRRVVSVPSLWECSRLRRIHIDRVMLTDLGPLAAAPLLEELLLLDMPQLRVEAFTVLQGHPTLRALTAGVCNERKRAAIRELVGLDEVETYGTDFPFSSATAT